VNKYERLKHDLSETKTGTMKCFGHSMVPILQSGTLNTYAVEDEYRIGDIVFCKVKGRYIDAHKITARQGDRYLISNNHGHDNGWTKIVYGRVVQAVSPDGTTKTFERK
jgi:hypothetical protein